MKIKLAVWSFILLSSFFVVKLVNGDNVFRSGRALTVLISQEGLTGGSRGSGILLDQTHVLTCAHMIGADDDEFLIYTYPLGKVIKAHVEGANKARDVAVLVLESSAPVTQKPVFQENIEEGDSVTIIGNALGALEWLVTRGVVSGHEKGYILSDAAIQHGNSGGPWFNDKGEIVAMSDWMIQPKEGSVISGGVSAKTINMVLQARSQADDMKVLIQQMLGGH